MTRGRALAVLQPLLLLLLACSGPPAELTPVIESEHAHDHTAFTQGLLYHDRKLFESTGLYGSSSLREVEPSTGEVVRLRELPDNLFGEGLARVDGRLIQLTWREGRALVYDLETFEQIGGFRYRGEGWGLCYDGRELWMSDGSSTLVARDADTFERTRELGVTLRGQPVTALNELECVGDHIYANVWQTDQIVRVDKRSGRVDAVVDASNLLGPDVATSLPADAVLNGIAYDAERDRFLLTGKLWPSLFVVRFE